MWNFLLVHPTFQKDFNVIQKQIQGIILIIKRIQCKWLFTSSETTINSVNYFQFLIQLIIVKKKKKQLLIQLSIIVYQCFYLSIYWYQTRYQSLFLIEYSCTIIITTIMNMNMNIDLISIIIVSNEWYFEAY